MNQGRFETIRRRNGSSIGVRHREAFLCPKRQNFSRHGHEIHVQPKATKQLFEVADTSCQDKQVSIAVREHPPRILDQVHTVLPNVIEAATNIISRRVTPHVFRHTTAVHLVAAGVDVTVIRSWLGHAHLDMTNHYAQANLETKRKPLEQADPSLRATSRQDGNVTLIC